MRGSTIQIRYGAQLSRIRFPQEVEVEVAPRNEGLLCLGRTRPLDTTLRY